MSSRESRHTPLSSRSEKFDSVAPGTSLKQRLVQTLPSPMVSLLRYVWNCLQGLEVFLIGAVGKVPSHHFRRAAYRYVFRVRIGKGSSIHRGTQFLRPRGVTIGDNCVLGTNMTLDGRSGLRIGNRVVTATDVMLYTLQHDMESPDFKGEGGPVVIEDYVYIGPRAIVLPSVTIGYGAVVAAGAVVTKDVAPYTVVGGIPARFLRERSHDLTYVPNFAGPFQ